MGVEERDQLFSQAEASLDRIVERPEQVIRTKYILIQAAEFIIDDLEEQRRHFVPNSYFLKRWEQRFGYKRHGWREAIKAINQVDVSWPHPSGDAFYDWANDVMNRLEEAWLKGADQPPPT